MKQRLLIEIKVPKFSPCYRFSETQSIVPNFFLQHNGIHCIHCTVEKNVSIQCLPLMSCLVHIHNGPGVTPPLPLPDTVHMLCIIPCQSAVLLSFVSHPFSSFVFCRSLQSISLLNPFDSSNWRGGGQRVTGDNLPSLSIRSCALCRACCIIARVCLYGARGSAEGNAPEKIIVHV